MHNIDQQLKEPTVKINDQPNIYQLEANLVVEDETQHHIFD
jgi:hypothetical protein